MFEYFTAMQYQNNHDSSDERNEPVTKRKRARKAGDEDHSYIYSSIFFPIKICTRDPTDFSFWNQFLFFLCSYAFFQEVSLLYQCPPLQGLNFLSKFKPIANNVLQPLQQNNPQRVFIRFTQNLITPLQRNFSIMESKLRG